MNVRIEIVLEPGRRKGDSGEMVKVYAIGASAAREQLIESDECVSRYGARQVVERAIATLIPDQVQEMSS